MKCFRRGLRYRALITYTYSTIFIDILLARINKYIDGYRYKSKMLDCLYSLNIFEDPEDFCRLLRFPRRLLKEDSVNIFYYPRFSLFLESPRQYGIYTASCNLIDFCCYSHIYSKISVPSSLIASVAVSISEHKEKRINSNNHLLLNYLAQIYCSILLGLIPSSNQVSILIRLIYQYFDGFGCSIEGSSSYQVLFTYWLGRFHYYLEGNSHLLGLSKSYDFFKEEIEVFYKRLLVYTSFMAYATGSNNFVIGDITPDKLGVNPYDRVVEEDILAASSIASCDSHCLHSSLPFVIYQANALTIGRLRNKHNNIAYNHSHHDFGCITWVCKDIPIIVDPGRFNYLNSDMTNLNYHSSVSCYPFLNLPSFGKVALNKGFINAHDTLICDKNIVRYSLYAKAFKWQRMIRFIVEQDSLQVVDRIKFIRNIVAKHVVPDFSLRFYFSPGIDVVSASQVNSDDISASLQPYDMATAYGESVKSRFYLVKCLPKNQLVVCSHFRAQLVQQAPLITCESMVMEYS